MRAHNYDADESACARIFNLFTAHLLRARGTPEGGTLDLTTDLAGFEREDRLAAFYAKQVGEGGGLQPGPAPASETAPAPPETPEAAPTPPKTAPPPPETPAPPVTAPPQPATPPATVPATVPDQQRWQCVVELTLALKSSKVKGTRLMIRPCHLFSAFFVHADGK